MVLDTVDSGFVVKQNIRQQDPVEEETVPAEGKQSERGRFTLQRHASSATSR